MANIATAQQPSNDRLSCCTCHTLLSDRQLENDTNSLPGHPLHRYKFPGLTIHHCGQWTLPYHGGWATWFVSTLVVLSLMTKTNVIGRKLWHCLLDANPSKRWLLALRVRIRVPMLSRRSSRCMLTAIVFQSVGRQE